MGRPPKKGLGYFPKDVDYYGDYKIAELLNEYGPLGQTVYDVILTMVYREGYYLAIPLDRLVTQIIRTIGNRWVKDKSLVLQVILFCGDIGLFDDGLLRQGVITSAGIQKRYAEVTARNKVNKSLYWLLDGEQLSDCIPSNGINAAETPVNAAETPVNAAETPPNQIKQNRSKVNQIKSQPACAGNEVASLPDEIDPLVLRSIEGRILGRKSSGREQSRIADLQREYGGARLLEAIKRTVAAGGHSIEYLSRVLKSAGDSSGSAAMCRNGCDYSEIEEMLDDEFYD